jgi:hypothetical protein
MALFSKRLADVVPEDLQALIGNSIAEARDIEFKSTVGKSDADRREFLADVSSFANATGGDLIIGINENSGVADSFAPIAPDAADAEILRLESIIRDGLDPRIPGVETRAVLTPDGNGVVLVIRIPRSFAAPHMVTLGNLSRFYSRNSAGKHQLDVTEIRAAFAFSDSARAALRAFRTERLGRLVAGDTPVPLPPNPKTVVHLVPLTAADPAIQIDATQAMDDQDNFRPLYGSAWNRRINFDGALSYAPWGDAAWAAGYTQLFRSGAVEGAEAFMLRRRDGDRPHAIPSYSFEEKLIAALRFYLRLLARLSVAPPYLLGLSLLDVRGLEMGVSQSHSSVFDPTYPIDRDELILPELLVSDPAAPSEAILKPAFDAVWQAAGWPGSLNYDDDGKWSRR